MSTQALTGSDNAGRPGATALALLASPRVFLILESLSGGGRSQTELLKSSGFPAQSTLRSHLKALRAVGAIASHRTDRFPGTIVYELSDAGRELLAVASIVERWLERSPGGPLHLGRDPARAAVKGLVEGWSSTILTVLSRRERTLTELDKLIDTINYPTIERRLTAMRLSGQVEARRDRARGTPYGLTEWARQGAAPLIAAARWETTALATAPSDIGFLDVEGAILLAAPLVRLPASQVGALRLILTGAEPEPARTDIVLDVTAQGISFFAPAMHDPPRAQASGSEAAWFAVLLEGDAAGIELDGDVQLATAVLDHAHRALFPAPRRSGEGEVPIGPPG